MLRLRTTSSLSLLALVIGIAGTSWISAQTAKWHGAAPRVTAVRHVALHVRHAPRSVLQTHRANLSEATRVIAAVHAAPVELLPLTTPVDASMSWDELRGHLDGRVVVQSPSTAAVASVRPVWLNPVATQSSTSTHYAACAAGTLPCRAITPMV